jgi:hypothetical protein
MNGLRANDRVGFAAARESAIGLNRQFAATQQSLGPVEAATREETHAAALRPGYQPIAVVLDLVNPLGADRRFRCPG